MHDTLNTRYDVLKERYIYHAELVGAYGFPQLPEVHAHPEGLRAVPQKVAGTSAVSRSAHNPN